jgi:hypothetical protein
MAVTRLKRKERRNKTTARVRVENIKLHKSRLFVKSPYEEISGIILEDGAASPAVAEVKASVPVAVAETPEVIVAEEQENLADSAEVASSDETPSEEPTAETEE